MQVTPAQNSAISISVIISLIVWYRLAFKAYLGFLNKRTIEENSFVTWFSSLEEGKKEILRLLSPHPLDENPKRILIRHFENYRMQVLPPLITVDLQLVQRDHNIHLEAEGDFSRLNRIYRNATRFIVFLFFPLIFAGAAFLSFMTVSNADLGWVWKLSLVQLIQIGFVAY